MILRIEDIDVNRCKPNFLKDMLEDIYWLGIRWHSGPTYQDCPIVSPLIGNTSHEIMQSDNEFFQSKRLDHYTSAWEILLRRGYIYPCKHSRKDVETALSAPHDKFSINSSRPSNMVNKKRDFNETETTLNDSSTFVNNSESMNSKHASELKTNQSIVVSGDEVIFPSFLRPLYMSEGFVYVRNCNSYYPRDVINAYTNPGKVNWRFRVPDGVTVSFTDTFCGKQTFTTGIDFGDFLVWRLDGYPSYELAVVVDDIAMGVSEVVRGQDLLLSTARQLLLLQALHDSDFQPTNNTYDFDKRSLELSSMESIVNYPSYFHSPLVCDEFGKRMAKRDFSKSIKKLREEGFTPQMIMEKYFDNVEEVINI